MKIQAGICDFSACALTHNCVNAHEKGTHVTSTQSYNRYSYCWNNPCLRDAVRQALKFVDPSGYMVSGGYYAPDINGENRRLQFENNSYYDHMYNRGDFSSKGGFGGLNASVWAGGYQYQVSSSGTLISTNHNMNGLQLDTRNGNYGFWAESFSVENTQVPDGLQLADGSITLRTAVKKNVFVPLLGLSKLLNDNPFSSHVMRQGWENNNGNKMRDHNMIRHTPQPQIHCSTSLAYKINLSFTIAPDCGVFVRYQSTKDMNFDYNRGLAGFVVNRFDASFHSFESHAKLLPFDPAILRYTLPYFYY
ncbi:MAG: hypothetical protein AB7V36_13580 [Bacteroidales bacterium]